MALKIIKSTIPVLADTRLVVRNFGTTKQQVVGKIEQGMYYPNNVQLTEDEFDSLAELIHDGALATA